jgi:Universal stress protein UspA and related nucleotide-binding proteins
MYESILLPTDGSAGATAAAEHAGSIASQYGATVHVLFVAEDDVGASGYVYGEQGGSEQAGMVGRQRGEKSSGLTNIRHDVMGAVSAHGEEVVASAADLLADVDKVETTVERGRAYETINDYCTSHEIDLIVMGTHGHSGVERYLLGSTAEKVIRTAPIPVMTIRAEE